jgi:hypothetical protein
MQAIGSSRLAATIGLSVALGSCVPAPPEYLSVGYGLTSVDLSHNIPDGKGAVVSVGYFSRAQMDDPRWEFARIQTAVGLQCGTGFKIVRRDVRWFHSGQRRACARVVYSLLCIPEKNRGTQYDHVNPEAFDQDVAFHLDRPLSSPLEDGCGEKDGYTLWEKRVKERNPGLVAPTLDDVRKSEIARVAALSSTSNDVPIGQAGIEQNARQGVRVRKLVCRPNSLQSFYCKFELRLDHGSLAEPHRWTVRRIRMQKRGVRWEQSEY